MDALFEAHQYWPVHLRFDGDAGFTLWGSGGGEQDRVLLDSDQLVLFRSLGSMAPSAMCETPLSPGQRAVMLTIAGRTEVPEQLIHYDFCSLRRALRGSERMSDGQQLNHLNMLWDVTRTLDLPSARHLGNGVLGELANQLMGTEAPLHRHFALPALETVLEDVGRRIRML